MGDGRGPPGLSVLPRQGKRAAERQPGQPQVPAGDPDLAAAAAAGHPPAGAVDRQEGAMTPILGPGSWVLDGNERRPRRPRDSSPGARAAGLSVPGPSIQDPRPWT